LVLGYWYLARSQETLKDRKSPEPKNLTQQPPEQATRAGGFLFSAIRALSIQDSASQSTGKSAGATKPDLSAHSRAKQHADGATSIQMERKT
jgi:hypothetical protein